MLALMCSAHAINGALRQCTVPKKELQLLQGAAPQIHSIATHPSQPDKCASGGSNGTVALWDLRFTSRPIVASTGRQHAGDVWQVGCPALVLLIFCMFQEGHNSPHAIKVLDLLILLIPVDMRVIT